MTVTLRFKFDFCILLISFIIFSSLVLFKNCDKIKSKIYKPIESKYFCFRRLNSTNQIGCNSKERGNVGVVYLVNTDNDMRYVLRTGENSPYIVVITAKDFDLQILFEFKSKSHRISGVVVLDLNLSNSTTVNSTGYSPDKSCPNVRFSLYSNDSTYGKCGQQQWNLAAQPYSEGIMFNDWPFPIFFIRNRTNIDEIKDCFNRFHGPDWPLCAMELKAPMIAAKDAITCIQRNSHLFGLTTYCEPLSGTNIFSTLLTTSKNNSIADKSIIVVSARMDSFSMFDNISPGADSAITSVVVLLSIAETLTKFQTDIKNKSNQKNVLFALFDGEAFDYIGSSRVVYDMSAGMFPVDPNDDLAQIRTKHFSHFIELNQLASHPSPDNQSLYIHTNLKTNEKIKQLSDLIVGYAKSFADLDIRIINESKPLPPSSLQTFLKNDNSIAGIVIANHKSFYSNKFYNSLYDDYSNVNNIKSKLSTKLTNIATVVSKVIYKLLTNETKDLAANETTVKELLKCYLINSVCNLHKYVSTPGKSFSNESTKPYPTYVGSSKYMTSSRYYTYLLLTYLSGEWLSKSKDECNDLNIESQNYNYYWMASPTLNGTCIKSQVQKRSATSPAFVDKNLINPYLYSSWTESLRLDSSVRLFIMSSNRQQFLTLIIGIFVVFISFVLLICFIIFYLPAITSTLSQTEKNTDKDEQQNDKNG